MDIKWKEVIEMEIIRKVTSFYGGERWWHMMMLYFRIVNEREYGDVGCVLDGGTMKEQSLG